MCGFNNLTKAKILTIIKTRTYSKRVTAATKVKLFEVTSVMTDFTSIRCRPCQTFIRLEYTDQNQKEQSTPQATEYNLRLTANNTIKIRLFGRKTNRVGVTQKNLHICYEHLFQNRCLLFGFSNCLRTSGLTYIRVFCVLCLGLFVLLNFTS